MEQATQTSPTLETPLLPDVEDWYAEQFVDYSKLTDEELALRYKTAVFGKASTTSAIKVMLQGIEEKDPSTKAKKEKKPKASEAAAKSFLSSLGL